jgi:hypothetical protein
MTVGSDNINRRSWTHGSELCCAIVDAAGELTRDTCVLLAREHLDLSQDFNDECADVDK